MPSKEEMVSKNEYSYNLPDQNLGLTVPSIIIDDKRLGMIIITKIENDQIQLR